MLPILVTMLACGGQLSYVTDEGACHDVNINDPGDPTLEAEAVDEGWAVRLNGVVKPRESVFTPEIESDGSKIMVREAWNEQGEVDFCFAPTVLLEDPPADDYQVLWYRDDGDLAYDSIVFTVE